MEAESRLLHPADSVLSPGLPARFLWTLWRYGVSGWRAGGLICMHMYWLISESRRRLEWCLPLSQGSPCSGRIMLVCSRSAPAYKTHRSHRFFEREIKLVKAYKANMQHHMLERIAHVPVSDLNFRVLLFFLRQKHSKLHTHIFHNRYIDPSLVCDQTRHWFGVTKTLFIL